MQSKTKISAAFAIMMAVLLLLGILPILPIQNAQAAVTMTDVDAVLIYNPRLTFEYYTNDYVYITNSLSTGSLSGSGIVTSSDPTPSEPETVPPQKGKEWKLSTEELARLADYYATGGIAARNPLVTPSAVSVGDTSQFFAGYSSYTKQNFTARAVGTYCVIWGTSAFSNTTYAQQLASEFDSYIYPQTSSLFGPARYMTDGAKLNILVYNMNNSGICGFFWGLELMTASELQSIYGVSSSSYNNSAPFFHLNSVFATTNNWETARNTLAHEFQHLLHFTAAVLNTANGNLDESMSLTNEGFAMEAEELLYPGSVVSQGYNRSYNNSTAYKAGKAPYNWDGADGVANYGFGWAFFDWYNEQAGSAAFADYLSYWRNASQTNLLDPNAFYNATPTAKRTEISNIANYAAATISSLEATPNISPYTSYNRSNNIFLSKMLLAFHIASVAQESNGSVYSLGSGAHGNITRPRYTSTSSASIEGGGCIYIKVNGSFTIPTAASAELIYVGFKNGAVVAGPTLASEYSADPTPSPDPDVTPTPTPVVSDTDWVLTDWTNIADTDNVVITMTVGTTVYALSSANGSTSLPSSVAIALTSDSSKLASEPAATLQWGLKTESSGKLIHVFGDTTKYLYSGGSNNGLRVGTASSGQYWTLGTLQSAPYLMSVSDSRYLGVYNNTDWRTYVSASSTNIQGQTLRFYVRAESASTPTPEPVTPTPAPITLLGDADCSGVVNAADAVLILRYLSGLDVMTEQGLLNAEVTSDGAVNASDAAKILRFLVGVETLG